MFWESRPNSSEPRKNAAAELTRQPDTSYAEEEFRKRLFMRDTVSEADVDQIVQEAFPHVCGEYGKEEFFNNTVPAVKQVYGSNYRKAGLRLLEIIDRAAEQKPHEIGRFFKNAITESELEFSRNKEWIAKDVEEKIKNTVLELSERYGDRYKGVIAAIVFGSYAKGNFHPKSDLDSTFLALHVASRVLKRQGLGLKGEGEHSSTGTAGFWRMDATMSDARAKLAELGRRLRVEVAYYRLVYQHPRTPLLSRVLLWLAITYALLPFDLIPDFIPVVGHLDDLVIVPALIVVALKLVPVEIQEECRAKLNEVKTH